MLRIVPLLSAASPTSSPPSWWRINRLRTEGWLYRLANRAGIPGAIQPMSFHDGVTGQQIDVRVGVLFTTLSIDGRDYYFGRVTGRFDGTGSTCRSPHGVYF